MDRIIAVTLGVFTVVLVLFVSSAGFSWYTENAYRQSLESTYTYRCTITTDSPLTNVTLFLPVPVDPDGNSPVAAAFSARTVAGLPPSWKTELYDTGKATLVKITAPVIGDPASTTRTNPYSVVLSASLPASRLIDTRDPVAADALYRPVTNLTAVGCGQNSGSETGGACSVFLTPLYASYQADPNAAVTVTSSIEGENSWNVFHPGENEYTAEVELLMFGEQNGWTPMRGALETGIGSYDVPVLSP